VARWDQGATRFIDMVGQRRCQQAPTPSGTPDDWPANVDPTIEVEVDLGEGGSNGIYRRLVKNPIPKLFCLFCLSTVVNVGRLAARVLAKRHAPIGLLELKGSPHETARVVLDVVGIKERGRHVVAGFDAAVDLVVAVPIQ
jgi:hypothetical protein